jgi:hypothetical protein
MTNPDRDLVRRDPAAEYETPELVVHGSVSDLTRGQGGPDPDVGTEGSQLGDTDQV